MCYMILVALPPKAQQTWLARLPKGLYAWDRLYPDLADHTNQWQPVLVGDGHCSCKLFQPLSDEKIRQLRRKYEKQGWSQGKIERALAEKSPEGFPGGLSPDLRDWLVHAAQEIGEAFLMIHWDSSNLALDTLDRLSIAEFQNQDYDIVEATLYQIVSDYSP